MYKQRNPAKPARLSFKTDGMTAVVAFSGARSAWNNRVGCLGLVDNVLPRFARFSAACSRPLFSSLSAKSRCSVSPTIPGTRPISSRYLPDTRGRITEMADRIKIRNTSSTHADKILDLPKIRYRVGDRLDRTRLWAPSLPRDIAVRATRYSVFRVSNWPWAQVK